MLTAQLFLVTVASFHFLSFASAYFLPYSCFFYPLSFRYLFENKHLIKFFELQEFIVYSPSWCFLRQLISHREMIIFILSVFESGDNPSSRLNNACATAKHAWFNFR